MEGVYRTSKVVEVEKKNSKESEEKERFSSLRFEPL